MQEDNGHMRPLVFEKLSDAKEAAENPDLVFRVGERVKVKGGDFRVTSIGSRFIVLEGLPGSRIKRGGGE